MGEIDQSQMPRTSQITLITLHAALFPLALPVLPIGQIVASPRADDPGTVDLHVYWTPGDEPGTSGWRSRVAYSLYAGKTFTEMVEDWKSACNGITTDLSLEYVNIDDPVPLATWLQAQELGVLGDHCALQAEVEGLGVATALA